MELRCRPGDLAVVVRCGDVLLPANLGALVQVVDRHTYDPAFGHVEEPAWQCIALSRIRVPLAQTEDEILELWAGNRLYVQDQFLRPLRNSTARDPFARPGAPRRYKAPALQAYFEHVLEMAENPRSALHNGDPRHSRTAVAFWEGYAGELQNPYHPGSYLGAAYAAGQVAKACGLLPPRSEK